MDFEPNYRHVGTKDGFAIEIFPTIVVKRGREYVYWYVHTWCKGVYKRQHHSMRTLGISLLIADSGCAMDDLAWEREPSKMYYRMPWHEFDEPVNAIYFIHALGTNRIKIGWAASLHARFNVLSCASPYPLSVIHAMSGDRKDEAELHRKFLDFHVHNEWHIYSDEIKIFIQQLKEQVTE